MVLEITGALMLVAGVLWLCIAGVLGHIMYCLSKAKKQLA